VNGKLLVELIPPHAGLMNNAFEGYEDFLEKGKSK
jgi:hypothetical protein